MYLNHFTAQLKLMQCLKISVSIKKIKIKTRLLSEGKKQEHVHRWEVWDKRFKI